MMRTQGSRRIRPGRTAWRRALEMRELYLFLLPALIVVLLFRYGPMYGVQIAFKDVRIGQAISQGKWAGLKHFQRFFNGAYAWPTIRNTLIVSFFNNFLTWPLPIVLALLMHNCVSLRVRRLAQTATYLPYLLSVVIVVSILTIFCGGESGLINVFRRKLGLPMIAFFGEEGFVVPLYVLTGIWQTCGYAAVVYLAALSAVDNELLEAARIDGATKLQCIWHIDLPTIRPTIVILFVMSMGRLFDIGTDKMLLMQTDLNLGASEILTTYVYKTGVVNAQYGFATAVSLFSNLVNLALLLSMNALVKRLGESSLF